MGRTRRWRAWIGWLGGWLLLTGAADPGALARRAESGDAGAQYRLGVVYATGDGVEADDGEAARWFRRAAESGNADAMFALGMLYATGAGVPLDAVQAHQWLHLCARLSDGEARQVALGARNAVTAEMTPEQVVEAQDRARSWFERHRVAVQ